MSLQLWGRHSLYLTILRIFRGCYSSFDFNVFVRKVSSVGFFAWIIFFQSGECCFINVTEVKSSRLRAPHILE